MANVLNSPADVVNDALRRIGYKLRVANLFDGSEASGYALDIYGQTRDSFIRDGNWQFCQRTVAAELLKEAPPGGYFPPTAWDPATYPPPPWRYTYAYPEDCLRVRMLKPQPEFIVNPDPQPTLYAVINDQGYVPARRVIATNVEAALLIYAARVTNPEQWPVDFTEMFCAALARRLAPSLANMDVTKFSAQDESAMGMAAANTQG